MIMSYAVLKELGNFDNSLRHSNFAYIWWFYTPESNDAYKSAAETLVKLLKLMQWYQYISVDSRWLMWSRMAIFAWV